MEAIFGGGVATGRYATGSNEPLNIPEGETIDLDADTSIEVDEDPIPEGEVKPKVEPTKKSKRKRVLHDELALMGGLTEAIKGFSAAVGDAIPGLYQAVMACPALGYLTEKKGSGLMFLEMTPDDRDLWLKSHLAKTYYM
ncbi:hypothetical protein BS78_01G115600 [Paspalum vaginatum]|nr:hypothetical protein BS78_01G115600 [Paspalum vaginatum]